MLYWNLMGLFEVDLKVGVCFQQSLDPVEKSAFWHFCEAGIKPDRKAAQM